MALTRWLRSTIIALTVGIAIVGSTANTAPHTGRKETPAPYPIANGNPEPGGKRSFIDSDTNSKDGDKGR